MANYLTTDTDLTAVANAIRTKGGTSASLAFPNGFVSAVEAIETGGGGSSFDLGDHSLPTGAVMTNVTELLGSTFRYRTGITSVSAPNCTKLNNYVFASCTALQSISLPVCTSFTASNNFDGCTMLGGIVLPAISGTMPGATFLNCTSMAYADFGPNLNYWNGNDFFKNCAALTVIILRKSAVCKLNNISYLAGTPFAYGGSGGTIYIPKTLYDRLGDGTALDYKAATNWSTIDGYGRITWAQIEGSIYENTYADGTPISA